MNNIEIYLDNDSTLMPFKYNGRASCVKKFLSKIFHRIGKYHTIGAKKRTVYEFAARLYYHRGLMDGASNIVHPTVVNVSKRDYDFLRCLLSLMRISFTYYHDMPFEKECVDWYNKKKVKPGLNMVSYGENRIPDEIMESMYTTIKELDGSHRSNNKVL